MRIRVKYVHTDTDRHGNERVYFQRGRGAPKIRLPAKSDSKFLEAYAAAIQGAPARINRSIHIAGSFGALIEAYLSSPEFKALKSSTQAVRRRVLDKLKEKHGKKLVKDMQPRHVRELRNEGLTAHAANSRLKFLKALSAWAVEVGLMEANVARDVPRLKVSTEGHQPWSSDEIARYRKRHPSGTKARLAFELLINTGARRADVVTLGRQIMDDGALKYRQGKTGKWITTPINKPLADELAFLPKDQVIFLLTEYGKPFTANGFGGWFRKRCDEADVEDRAAHGLRKSGATIAADEGATAHQVKAFGGWTSLAEAERYTRSADGKRLSGDVVKMLERKGHKNSHRSD